jgi:hypothetical protein
VGTDAMREIYAAAVHGEIAYVGGGTPEVIRPGHVGWQTWIDLVDERGVVPAGDRDLDWLQELLVQVGAADASTDLARRSAARAAYHALQDATDSWAMPMAIRSAMASWQWDEADEELETGQAIFEAHASAMELVDELSDSGAVRTSFEEADSADDLHASLTVATDERDAAELVADAVTAAGAERNPIEWVGLLGSDLTQDASDAVDELVSADFGGAESAAKATSKSKDDAATSGLIRLGGGAIVLGLGGGTFFFMRRRGREAASPTVGPDATGEVTLPTDAGSPDSGDDLPPADSDQVA